MRIRVKDIVVVGTVFAGVTGGYLGAHEITGLMHERDHYRAMAQRHPGHSPATRAPTPGGGSASASGQTPGHPPPPSTSGATPPRGSATISAGQAPAEPEPSAAPGRETGSSPAPPRRAVKPPPVVAAPAPEPSRSSPPPTARTLSCPDATITVRLLDSCAAVDLGGDESP